MAPREDVSPWAWILRLNLLPRSQSIQRAGGSDSRVLEGLHPALIRDSEVGQTPLFTELSPLQGVCAFLWVREWGEAWWQVLMAAMGGQRGLGQAEQRAHESQSIAEDSHL